jgi:putative membrane protein
MIAPEDDGTGAVIQEAEFDPRLRTYLMLATSFYLLISVVGILVLPFWLLGLGQYWAKRHFASLRCALTERSLIVERGVLFTVQKTIPLQRIQDLTVRGGPLLRGLGLEMMSVETAGQSQAQGSADARLVGVIDLRRFRQRVLEQCRVVESGPAGPASSPEPSHAVGSAAEPDAILVEIRDSLHRIEQLLSQGRP